MESPKLTPKWEAEIRADDAQYIDPMSVALDRRVLLSEVDRLRSQLQVTKCPHPCDSCKEFERTR